MSRNGMVKKDELVFEIITGEHENSLKELTADGKTEKHVPYVEELEDGYLVRIGEEIDHPMTEEHWILFVELIIDDNRVYKHFLNPGDKPETVFKVEKGNKVIAREYCNIHGLWKNDFR